MTASVARSEWKKIVNISSFQRQNSEKIDSRRHEIILYLSFPLRSGFIKQQNWNSKKLPRQAFILVTISPHEKLQNMQRMRNEKRRQKPKYEHLRLKSPHHETIYLRELGALSGHTIYLSRAPSVARRSQLIGSGLFDDCQLKNFHDPLDANRFDHSKIFPPKHTPRPWLIVQTCELGGRICLFIEAARQFKNRLSKAKIEPELARSFQSHSLCRYGQQVLSVQLISL